MKDEYNKTISLNCPLCGSTQFEYDEENESSPITCLECKTDYTRDELIEKNQESVDAAVDEIKKEVDSDISKIFSKFIK